MRLYTVAEARALLPEVIPVLEALRDAFVQLRELQASVASDARHAGGNGHLKADAWHESSGEDRLETLNREVRSAARQLGGWGIELKDPARGLIDFHAERDGEVVYLCYELGEATITHWHRIADGYAGRQPL